MRIKKKVFALICQNDGAEDRPIIMESYVDESDQQKVMDRIRKIRKTHGEVWIVELPLCVVGADLEINEGEEGRVNKL